MSIHAWMLAGLLMGAPPSPPADAAPAPRFEKGQEIIWRGTFSEAILRTNVRAFRAYEVETRLFVLDVCDAGADLALFTSIKLKPDVKTIPEPTPIVRLELVRVDGTGNFSQLTASSLKEPPENRKGQPLPLELLEGLPTLETRMIVAFPAAKVRLGQTWTIPKEKRPAVVYRLDGYDTFKGTRCFKVSTAQQTDDWDQQRSEGVAWRRGEMIWVSAKYGYATRFERVVEKRDPQSGEIGFRSKLIYEQASGVMRYPDRFGEDRRKEIAAGATFFADFDEAIADVRRPDGKPFERLAQRIDQHVADHFGGESLPYREAVLYVKRKAEAAIRGHIPPLPPLPETSQAPTLAIGKPAPEINGLDLTNNETIRLSALRGRPVLLVYYQPASVRTAEPVLRFAESLTNRLGGKVVVLPVVVGNSEAALAQRQDLKLTVHLLAGRNAVKAHGIESTPAFVLLDEQGLVRNVTLGWCDENVAAVQAELGKVVK